MSDGSVCLAEYVRRRGEQKLHAHVSTPIISSVTLSKREFGTLAPREALRGKEWTLPEEVAKRFCRLTSPLCYQHAPQPDWVTDAHIDARVGSVEDGVARVSYAGRISSVHVAGGGGKISQQKVTLTGQGLYDTEAKRLRSLLIVGPGTLLWTEAPDQPVPFDALAEWELQASEGSSNEN